MSEIQTPEVAPKPASDNTAAILTGAALLGGAALFATPKAARAQTKPQIDFNEANFGPTAGDVKVLNFALSLEALETELYVQALHRLTTGGNGGQYAPAGLNITGLGQSESSPAVRYLREFGQVERAHRNFLDGALGNASILAQGNALNGVAFDFGFGSNQTNLASVVNVVRDAEATGVMAYIGAVPSFSPNSIYLQTAAAIEGTEARHTAVVTAIYNGITGQNLPVAPLSQNNQGRETFQEPQQIINKVRPFIILKGEAGNTNGTDDNNNGNDVDG